MEVICLEDEAFYALVDKIEKYIKDKQNIKQDEWISGVEVMQMLRIKSKTTLQRLRDSGEIEVSQESKKLILYNSESIRKYIEKHSKGTF
jgi:hypothetical protein